MMSDKAAQMLAGAIIIAGFLIGGIYQIGDGGKRLNKFTGSISTCYESSGCR